MQIERGDVHSLCWVRDENVMLSVTLVFVSFLFHCVVAHFFYIPTYNLKMLTAVGTCLGINIVQHLQYFTG